MASYQVCAHVGWEELSDSTVVVSLKGGAYYEFSGSAKIIWDLISKGQSVQQIVDQLINIFGISAQTATEDLNAFLQELISEGLIIS